MLHGQRAAFTLEAKRSPEILYRVEESRGYDSKGELWSPGYFRIDLAQGQDATLVASTESWETIQALEPGRGRAGGARCGVQRLIDQAPPEAQTGLAGELVLAADQFIITPAGRVEEAARARAAGDEVRTVIAGYHWFTDWGRDTMISLEGLTLCTGRRREAGYILRTFAHYVRDGLIPNLFPEGEKEGLYHTADATLWFFHAVHRYLQATGDRTTLQLLLPKFRDIVACHLRGTRFGIRVDPADGLLGQGQEGYQLTWMDAKVGDWVVTPRRGKAVEINALWYNALRLLEGWLREEGDEAAAAEMAGRAEQARASFNRRFWNADKGYLFDVVDGEKGDDAVLPAQSGVRDFARPSRSSTASAGRRCWSVVQRAAVDAGGPALAGAGQPRLQAAVLRRPARAATPPTIRARSGRGWSARSWTPGCKAHPDDRAGARRVPVRLRPPPGRGVHRLDQRNLRRRGAVHAARLHRAGVERRRGAARAG